MTRESGLCLICGHPMQEVRPGNDQCPHCELEASWWEFMLKDLAHELLNSLDWSQIVLTIEPEIIGSGTEVRKLLREEIIRRLERKEYALGTKDLEEI